MILNSKKSNLHKARTLTDAFCFADNLYTINENSLFEKHFKKLWPEKLDLKNENVSSTKASFLVIDLEIKDNNISNKLYHKWDK